MKFIRRHLGVWTFAWLSCQVAAMSALVPGIAHDTLAVECHEATPAEACPMRAVDGEACPMHDGSNAADATEQCAIRATSSAPVMALASLFSLPGVLLTQSSASVDTQVSPLLQAADRLTAAPFSLETPPPRS